MKQLTKLVQSETLLNQLFYLKDRWNCEKEYEDFKDYEEAMKKAAIKICKDITAFKATKRPFGFKFKDVDGKQCHVFLKRKGAYINLAGKRAN
jgi:hypothetical protein